MRLTAYDRGLMYAARVVPELEPDGATLLPAAERDAAADAADSDRLAYIGLLVYRADEMRKERNSWVFVTVLAIGMAIWGWMR